MRRQKSRKRKKEQESDKITKQEQCFIKLWEKITGGKKLWSKNTINLSLGLLKGYEEKKANQNLKTLIFLIFLLFRVFFHFFDLLSLWYL
jgi:hypothetical protein